VQTAHCHANVQKGRDSSVNAIQTPSNVDSVYERRESNVRSYCRSFPAEFTTAKGVTLTDADGNQYLDFFAGAGALNFGHSNDRLKQALLTYIESDGIVHALDLHTEAKTTLLNTIETVLLQPRNLPYKVQFTGPTGANAVEAALKLARNATGRTGVFSFMGGYHGHSLGGLAATANRDHRAAAGTGLHDVTFLPFPGMHDGLDTIAYLRSILEDGHSGIEIPAAVIVETIQAEGGICVAPTPWLQALRSICSEFDIVLIIDDIQTGCGRTGSFFSFERAGIVPDIVTVSKSISGYGLPMSLVLIKPELDIWKPADHTGTFRGNQLAFVTSAEMIRMFHDEEFERRTNERGEQASRGINELICSIDPRISARGIGMMWGIDLSKIDPTGAFAKRVGQTCFAEGLVIERVGRNDTVLKLLPPLTISPDELDDGLCRIAAAIKICLDHN
jgi:diaminobutyrate-2-oxoglutarate transaminase